MQAIEIGETRAARRPHVLDQAAGLRRMLAARGMRILPVLDAEGGAREASAAVALAASLVEQGSRVLIADQTPGAVARHLGLRTRYELSHVMDGDKDWNQVVLPGPEGIMVLPAGRGLARISDHAGARALLDELYRLPAEPDVLILNISSAEAAECLLGNEADGDWLVVFSCHPSGLVPAYRSIKQLARVAMPRAVHALACDAPDPGRAENAFGSLAAASSRFLGLDLRYAGELPEAKRRGAPKPASLPRALAAGIEEWRLMRHAPNLS